MFDFAIREDAVTSRVEVRTKSKTCGCGILVQAWYLGLDADSGLLKEVPVKVNVFADLEMTGILSDDAEQVSQAIIQAVALAKAQQFRFRLGHGLMAQYEETKTKALAFGRTGDSHGLSDGEGSIQFKNAK